MDRSLSCSSCAPDAAMVFMIVLAAAAYSTFRAAVAAAAGAGGLGRQPPPVAPRCRGPILVFYLAFYFVFGCVVDSLSMILLSIPIFFPMIRGRDFGVGTPEETAIRFGLLVLIVVEVGLITPPVRMNLFVIQTMAAGISIRDTYRGVWSFEVSDLARVAIVFASPIITLAVLRP